MEKGQIMIICGEGKGKTSAAIGRGISGASKGKSVIIIRFLKGKVKEKDEFIKRLEPEIKVFSFEKSEKHYCDLSEEERQEEAANMQNGVNFAKKVLSTRGCDILILDEILGLVDCGVIEAADIARLLEARAEDVDVIMTGIVFPEELFPCVDRISRIDSVEVKGDGHNLV